MGKELELTGATDRIKPFKNVTLAGAYQLARGVVLSKKFVGDELYCSYRDNPVALSAIISIGLQKASRPGEN
jgi:hypothetical protein